ncbi:MAG: alpha-amylase family glycosyl hydrolase [Gammaproteobacteria bacterium]|nr:alpha-amylase family glycosyl hydrolase [Gammaproteobacteria bacterium]MDH3767009.1 alpha-amylase family glycosyl hydrolase [Gammaproteobacteria bacterium]
MNPDRGYVPLCLLMLLGACGGGGSEPSTQPPPTTPPPSSGQPVSSQAFLSGYNITPPVDSFGTGVAALTVDDGNGSLTGTVRLAGISATAVTVNFSDSAIATLLRDGTDPNQWRVADGTTLTGPQLQAYLAGELDILASSVAFPAGELGARLAADGMVLLPDNGSIGERTQQDEVIYFVMTDRFFNGSTTNDNGDPSGSISYGGFEPFSTAGWHGGDFIGLTNKLDYIHGLGITAIWVTPPVANSGPNAYHGYWAVDYENIDPHLGTNAEYQAFIDAAHARGIKVYQDAVINHTADVITYAEGQFDYRPLIEPPYTPVIPPQWANAKNPTWLNDPQYYHNRGNTTFSGESSIYGDFFGLDDIATEIPFVREQFIDIYNGWVAMGVDGFRMDTAKHVRMNFWNDFAPALQDFAHNIGNDHLAIFGEAFDGNAVFISEFFTRGEMPSMLNFPLHFALPDAFARTSRLDEIFDLDDRFTDADSDARDLVNFFGNHDIGRAGGIIRSTLAGLDDAGQVEAIKLAYAMNFFLRGVPTIYYGDEQGFPGDGGDQGAREDMMASEVASYNNNDLIGTDATTATDNFDQSHPLYRTFARYAEVYKQNRTLRRGLQIQRFSRPQPGLYAVSRVEPEDGREYLVVFNTASSSDSASIVTDTPNAMWYSVWPPAEPALSSNGQGTVTVAVPGREFAIYRSDTPIPAASPVVSLSISNLGDGQPVEDIVEILVDTGSDEFRRVWFETSIDSGPFELAGADFTAPFRLYWDSGKVAGPAVVTLRANVANPGGDVVSTQVDVNVDNREITTLNVQYENGNSRGELVLIDEDGEVVGPTPVNGSDALQFALSSLDGALTLIYQDSDGDVFSFDRPIFIEVATQLQLAADNGGDLELNLYINNDHTLDNQPNHLGSGLPPTLPFDPLAPAPFADTELFVRGSFNNWATANPLTYAGNYTYQGRIENVGGGLFYKIADADWSSTTDFGGPYTASGLSIGVGTRNLDDTVANGTYDFYFFSVPDHGNTWNFHQPVERVDPNANNPFGVAVFVRGSFNDWGLDNPMSYDETTETFSATIALEAADYELKIASEDWATADFGGDGIDNNVILGVPKALQRTSINLDLSLTLTGDYDFNVDTSNLATPVLTVSPTLRNLHKTP